PEQDKAFQALKLYLTTAPGPRYPDFEKTFYLYTDASGTGLEVVLAQRDEKKKEYAIVYASKGLIRPEKNYMTTELECYAVEEEQNKAISYCKKMMTEKENIGQNESFQEAPVNIVDIVEEVKVFRTIAQEYFAKDSDEELEMIPWDKYEELTTQEVEYKRYIQSLLTELALELGIDIIWLIRNGYNHEYTNNQSVNNPQSMNLGETYLINIPQWEETTKELEFEARSDDEYKYMGYGYYNSQLGSNHCWWNTNEDEEIFSEFTANLENPEWFRNPDLTDKYYSKHTPSEGFEATRRQFIRSTTLVKEGQKSNNPTKDNPLLQAEKLKDTLTTYLSNTVLSIAIKTELGSKKNEHG
ncbi:4776_t:CDS:2, partial [Dentiscutata erythropus]